MPLDSTGATGINVSGASDLAPLDKQAAMIKELFPEARIERLDLDAVKKKGSLEGILKRAYKLKNLFENEETKGMVMSLLEGALDSYKDRMVGEDNFLGGELIIKEVTPTTLTLQDETGEDVIFTRIKE